VADIVRLTIVNSQVEADVLCSMLRAHGIECFDREPGISMSLMGVLNVWREILVSEDDLEAAQELLAATEPAE
jgi:hypothetical protein